MPDSFPIIERAFVYLENMQKKDSTKLSAYLFLEDQMKQHFLIKENPKSFVKYGKYEMRLMDKMRIEAGFVTKAKVKWYGIRSFAYPYLRKVNKSDMEYKESWSDPRVKKTEKAEKRIIFSKNLTKNKGRKCS